MNKFIRISKFAEQLFTNEKQVRHAGQILEGIIRAHSPRLSDIAAHMPGHPSASYKRIQRFLQEEEPQESLKMLFNEEADFVIGDPTEIKRPHADKTGYVGTLIGWSDQGFLDVDPGDAPEGQSDPLSLSDLFFSHL